MFALIGAWKVLSLHAGNYSLAAATINVVNLATDTAKKPVFTLEESTVTPFIILTIRDTAATTAEISRVLGRDYGEIFAFIQQNGFRPGRMMAFYHSYQPTFILEAAIEVDKLPGQLSGRVTAKEVTGGKAIIARYKGPYEQVGIAYAGIYSRLKEQNKTADGPPFEVYLNDPLLVNDPFELRTDVYQLIK